MNSTTVNFKPQELDTSVWTPEASRVTFNIIMYVGTSFIWVVSFAISIMIIVRRNHQPIKKKSPLLIIMNVIGNFMVIVNLVVCQIIYHMVIVMQGTCYYGENHYDASTVSLGNQCMTEKFNEKFF
jgi:uncharacterized membrane protein YhaH (DUF805 family)